MEYRERELGGLKENYWKKKIGPSQFLMIAHKNQ